MQDKSLNLKNCKRIAVMGGTFDPIHYGHLAVAEAVRYQYDADRVIFIPTGKPPHKNIGEMSQGRHRYLMTALATASNPYFDVSAMEIDRVGLTYTVDTVRELRKICRTDAEIYFITGADAVQQILSWKDAKELVSLCSFVAVTRPGFTSKTVLNQINHIQSNNGRVHFLEVPAFDISSSNIRNRVYEAKPIRYLLPEEVGRYIVKFGLYKEEPLDINLNLMDVHHMLESVLSQKRHKHTLGVSEEAVALSRHYGAPANKAYIAALFHDCAKDSPESTKRKMCKQYCLTIDPVMDKQIDLIHGLLAADIAKIKYGIDDQDILNALRYHTTGRKGMSLLEKIIYVADCIEPYRNDYPGLSNIRDLAYKNLDMAVIAGIKATIDENKTRGRLIHPWSKEALEDLKRKEDVYGEKHKSY